MYSNLIPDNEFTRLQALRALNILDTTSDIRFDLITHYASHAFNAPITSISLTDANRHWFKSSYGLNVSEVPRNTSICSYAIYELTSVIPEKRILQINNTRTDFRFANLPLVLESPKIHAYMSYVIQSACGNNIGTLCIADRVPRIFSVQEKKLLVTLGQMAQDLIHSYSNHTLTHTNSTSTNQDNS